MALRVSRRGLDLGGKVEDSQRRCEGQLGVSAYNRKYGPDQRIRVLRPCEKRDGGKYRSPRDQERRGREDAK